MKRKAMRSRFVRTDFMHCRCRTGLCPNYDMVLCNRRGGQTIMAERGHAVRVVVLKKLLQTDINIKGEW